MPLGHCKLMSFVARYQYQAKACNVTMPRMMVYATNWHCESEQKAYIAVRL